MPKDLLDKLAEQNDCFISSLKEPSMIQKTLRNLFQIKFEDYSLKQWNDCLSYLFGVKPQFRTECEIWEFLKKKQK
ncbi:MAG: hypothetical protein LKJ45_01665 [Oscillospiraceae bacterium]|jgi:hypothetical protein|nr:hypothetical protein [Oscillospiraceae bacterium]